MDKGNSQPLINLLPFQEVAFWLRLRTMFFLWARQRGKSYLIAAKAIDRMLERAGRSCYFVSASIATGKEIVEKEAQIWHDALAKLREKQEALGKALGGRRVIFHAGSCGKQSREEALEKALDTMARAVKACDEAGFEDCILCPETMGKVNQLGTLDEVLALCEVDPRITPCIDFGHLYARSCGVQFADATAAADYAALLDTLAARLGDDRAVHFHAHFSRIAYTKGGEKRHLTFADTAFGPPHAPLLALLKERHLAPTIICESAGTQAEDAAALAQGYATL